MEIALYSLNCTSQSVLLMVKTLTQSADAGSQFLSISSGMALMAAVQTTSTMQVITLPICPDPDYCVARALHQALKELCLH